MSVNLWSLKNEKLYLTNVTTCLYYRDPVYDFLFQPRLQFIYRQEQVGRQAGRQTYRHCLPDRIWIFIRTEPTKKVIFKKCTENAPKKTLSSKKCFELDCNSTRCTLYIFSQIRCLRVSAFCEKIIWDEHRRIILKRHNIIVTNSILGLDGRSCLSTWKYQFSYDHWSQATLSSVSTWMGDCSKCCLSVAANP